MLVFVLAHRLAEYADDDADADGYVGVDADVADADVVDNADNVAVDIAVDIAVDVAVDIADRQVDKDKADRLVDTKAWDVDNTLVLPS